MKYREEGGQGTGCQLSHSASLSTSLVGKRRVEARIRRNRSSWRGVQGPFIAGGMEPTDLRKHSPGKSVSPSQQSLLLPERVWLLQTNARPLVGEDNQWRSGSKESLMEAGDPSRFESNSTCETEILLRACFPICLQSLN